VAKSTSVVYDGCGPRVATANSINYKIKIFL